MTSLKKTVLSCLGVAIASSLTFSPASAQPKPQQEKAAALGGPITPSNQSLFQAQAQSAETSITLDAKEKALQSGNTPMDWQSEHLLDEQRQFDSNISIVNIDLK